MDLDWCEQQRMVESIKKQQLRGFQCLKKKKKAVTDPGCLFWPFGALTVVQFAESSAVDQGQDCKSATF